MSFIARSLIGTSRFWDKLLDKFSIKFSWLYPAETFRNSNVLCWFLKNFKFGADDATNTRNFGDFNSNFESTPSSSYNSSIMMIQFSFFDRKIF